MRRRDFMTLLGRAAAAWPLAARAQQSLPRVVYVPTALENDPEQLARQAAFRIALEKFGWTDGRNVRIDYRWGRIEPERLRAVAAELVGLMPNVIVESGSDVAQALKRETSTIPVVFVTVSDPLSSGLVANMARPGGNLTGFANYPFSIAVKWVQTLKDVSPEVKRVLVIFSPDNPGVEGLFHAIETAASQLGVQPVPARANNAQEIEKAIGDFAGEPEGGLLALPGPLSRDHGDLMISLAARYRLPAMYTYRFSTANGGLMSYDTDTIAQIRGAASYVDRILRGEKPGDLPVQLPTKYDLVINLKTARTIGLTVPLSLLASADEVIE